MHVSFIMSGCGGTLSGARGEIISPNYPQPYGGSADCLWKIAVASGSQVRLVFVDFELEDHTRCRYDYIEVSIGNDDRRRSGTRYCSSTHPPFVDIDSNMVTVRFKSDFTNHGRGFHIRYETRK